MSEEQTIGAIFRKERARKGVTASKAASETRIKVQHIEAMENDDFSVMAAATYAKGFIKLYAEYLELDPKPLVDAYVAKHAAEQRSPLAKPEKMGDGGKKPLAETVQKLAAFLKGIPREKWIQSGSIVAGLLVAYVLVAVISQTARSCDQKAAEKTQEAAERHEILQEPPEPYL